MRLDSRLRKLEALIATRGGGRHPTVIRLTLRNQRFLLDSAENLPDDWWEPLDPGGPDTLRRAAFDLALIYDESQIWQAADKADLREALEELLGRGPLTAADLAAQEAEFFHPLTAEEFYAKIAAERADELRQAIVEAAEAAGEPCPPWLDRLQGDLTAEEAEEIDAWLAAHLAPVEPGEAVPVEQEPVPVEPATNAPDAV